MKVDIFTTPNKYNIIYEDPPWQYNKRNNTDTRFGKGAFGHYDLMSMKSISELPLPEISAENCAMFMRSMYYRYKK